MVKTLSSDARSTASIPVQGGRIPHALGPKKTQNIENQKNMKTNSIKTLKIVHTKKKKNSCQVPTGFLLSSLEFIYSFVDSMTVSLG